MHDAAAVRVGHRVAKRHETGEKPTQGQAPLRGVAAGRVGLVEAGDGLLKALPPDEAHRVVGLARRVEAHAVDGDDARVLQAAGDLGLEQEAPPEVLIGGQVRLHPFERHLAVQLGVVGEVDLARPADADEP